MMATPTTRKSFAEYLQDQARWRREVAERFPDDDRNVMWAHRLDELSQWVLTLPNDHPDLETINQVWSRYGLDVFSVTGPISQSMTSKPAGEPEAWLEGFARTYAEEEMESYFDVLGDENLLETAQEHDPQIALVAIRRLRSEIDLWEEEAVLRAQVEGYPWSRIGALLGKSAQTVWKKYSDPEDETID